MSRAGYAIPPCEKQHNGGECRTSLSDIFASHTLAPKDFPHGTALAATR